MQPPSARTDATRRPVVSRTRRSRLRAATRSCVEAWVTSTANNKPTVSTTNDDAWLTSFDVSGALEFRHPAGIQGHHVDAVDVDRATALAEADVVVTGVAGKEVKWTRCA